MRVNSNWKIENRKWKIENGEALTSTVLLIYLVKPNTIFD
jgi:hypothetical protein